MKNKITKSTILSEILKDSKNVKILEKYKLPCLGCPCVQYEMDSLEIGQVCEMYKIDLKSLLEELNKK